MAVIISQAGDKKDTEAKKPSSSKDKDGRLWTERAKEPTAPNKKVIELVYKHGGRQNEVLRKESLWDRLPCLPKSRS